MCVCVYIYIYIHLYTCMCIYIYIYVMCVYIYIYIHLDIVFAWRRVHLKSAGFSPTRAWFTSGCIRFSMSQDSSNGGAVETACSDLYGVIR